jgi:L-fuconate dehydratase
MGPRRDVDGVLDDLGAIGRELTSDSQLRWLGPEKGIIHNGDRRGAQRTVGPEVPSGPASHCGSCSRTCPPRRIVHASTSYICPTCSPQTKPSICCEQKADGKAEREAELLAEWISRLRHEPGWLVMTTTS